ncbi:hypothetical protein RFI_33001 [Reticulomyxa filosa]|uniref:Ubiquitin-like domain-containing protein n=1 Tax=Reticulomyxa filosa TaxID=46433 RepID=X6LTI4_RETFI|nr:hypothetical protein RFI_33001 [Reticulomyxa filosa]|eukprot:ETO04397.1 hypothetical protein RFI_33001 [Reticulomyxa filosa]
MSKYFNNLMIRLDAAGKKTINFNLNSKISGSTTVGELKKLIEDREGVRDVRLIYLTKQLEREDLKLSDYNVNDGATLFAVFRLLGGSVSILDESKLKQYEDEYKIAQSNAALKKVAATTKICKRLNYIKGEKKKKKDQMKKKKTILNCLCGAAINVGLAVCLGNFSETEARTIENQFKLKSDNKGTFNKEQVEKFGVTVSCEAMCAWNMSKGCRDKSMPKVTLRCGHTFCSDCMDKYINDLLLFVFFLDVFVNGKNTDRIAVRAVNVVCPFVCENISYLTNELAFTIANYDERAWDKAVSKFRQNGASKTSMVMYADLFLLFLNYHDQVYQVKLEQGNKTKIETLLSICETLGAFRSNYEKPILLRKLEVLKAMGPKVGSQEGAQKENSALTLEDHKVVNWETLNLETYRYFDESLVTNIKMEDDFKLSSWSLTTSDCSLGIHEACSMANCKRLSVKHKDGGAVHIFCNSCLFESFNSYLFFFISEEVKI